MKNSVIFLMILCFLGTSCLTSCKKDNYLEKTVKTVSPTKTDVKIFTFGSDSNDGLKASAIQREIKNGDTVSYPRGANVLIWVKDAKGNPFYARWNGWMVKNDYPDYCYNNKFAIGESGDQIVTNFPDNGIYEIFIMDNGFNVVSKFYVLIDDVPGKNGDKKDNNFIFRVEVKTLNTTHGPRDIIFVYYKYEMVINPVDAYAFLDLFKNGQIIYGNWAIPVKKYPFSKDNYYYFTIDDGASLLMPGRDLSIAFDDYKVLFVKAIWQNGVVTSGYDDKNRLNSTYYDFDRDKLKITW